MISPYVRRLRLAAELRSLRIERALTHEQLARKTGLSRAQLSRLENGHVVDQADIITILDALGVDGDRWMQVVAIAREAGERGWWESNRAMGERQALYANLEAGAATIREFQMTFIPGLLQTPEFARARIEAERHGAGQLSYGAEQSVEARNGRQRMLRRPGGPSYDVIIDEVALRRATAPPDVVRAQLYHVAARVNSDPKTSVRVLPVEAAIEGFSLPRTAFSIYTFPDPGDPVVVAVDTVTDDLLLTDDPHVTRYQDLYRRLQDAALPVSDSLKFLIATAKTAAKTAAPAARAPAPGRARVRARAPVGAEDPVAAGTER